MFRPSDQARFLRRTGMTLVELLAASAITVLMVGTLGALSLAVQNTNQYQFSRSLSLQHAQVVILRLQRQLQRATANDQFPGFAVFAETVGSESFPNTLVVWTPAGNPANPTGMPLISELYVYCPNPGAQNELWEITKPLDTRTAPSLSNLTAWQQELADFRTSNQAERVVVTDLLRIGTLRNAGGSAVATRTALRFETAQRPSAAQWQQFLANGITWDDLPWVQGIHGRTMGLAQSRCHFEFQLSPGDVQDNRRDVAIPFFSSAATYFELKHP